MSYHTRNCTFCGKEFEPSHFNSKKCSDACRQASVRQSVRIGVRKWKVKNPDWGKEYYLANKSEINKRHVENYFQHKIERLIRRKNRYQKQKVKVKDQVKRYRSIPENKEKIRTANKKRRILDLNYAIRCRLAARLGHALRKNNIPKTSHTSELIGCSLDHLKYHLESQFKDGMSWDNKGQWHIDHIRPCASFDLTDPIQQKACFNYTNLQPLWSKDNCSKGAKWIMSDQLCIGDRVKYKQTFLDCWKSKDLPFYKSRRGTLIKVLGMGGLVHWDNEENLYPQEQGLFDLERE